jgi:hypothetical protein
MRYCIVTDRRDCEGVSVGKFGGKVRLDEEAELKRMDPR